MLYFSILIVESNFILFFRKKYIIGVKQCKNKWQESQWYYTYNWRLNSHISILRNQFLELYPSFFNFARVCSKELQRFFRLAAALMHICRRISHGLTSPILYIRIYVYERGKHEDKLKSLRQLSAVNEIYHCIVRLLSAITTSDSGLSPVYEARTLRNFVFQGISHLRLFIKYITCVKNPYLINRRRKKKKKRKRWFTKKII